jgi:hypothetical protein
MREARRISRYLLSEASYKGMLYFKIRKVFDHPAFIILLHLNLPNPFTLENLKEGFGRESNNIPFECLPW